jgi:hypothetical protein
LQRPLTKEGIWISFPPEKNLLTKSLTVKDLWKKPDGKNFWKLFLTKKYFLKRSLTEKDNGKNS